MAGLFWLILSGCIQWVLGFFPNYETIFIVRLSTIISHGFLGYMVSLYLPVYIVHHIKKTIGFRRPFVLMLGILSCLPLLALSYTGLHIVFLGHQEANHHIPFLHILAAVFFILLLFTHLGIHSFFLSENRKKSNKSNFPSLSGLALSIKHLSILFLSSVVGLSSFHYLGQIENNKLSAITPYALNYGSHPFRPSQTETVNNEFINESLMANSENCIDCHKEIGQQWLSSAHRHAASDKAYVTNISLLVKNKGIQAARYCEGCHAPIALLSGNLTPGGIHGGVSQTPANEQGVNCLSCHGIKRLIHTKGVASYEFGLPMPYLFEYQSNVIAKFFNHLSIKLQPSQHRRDVMTTEMSTSAYCSSCHSQFMDMDMNQWGWVQLQDEYQDWLNSPYSGRSDQNFSHSERKNCQDCHMPFETGRDPSSNRDRKIRSHRFLGGNTVLPLINNDPDHLHLTQRFLQKNKLRITIDKPHRTDATQTTRPIDETLRNLAVQPYYYYKGETVQMNLTVSNIGIGHSFPGGTIDINEAWVAIQITDAQGELIYSKGFIEDSDALPEDVYAYRSIPIDRQGQRVWKHDLFNMIGDLSKNVIPAGKSDVVKYEFKVPHWAKSPLNITAQLNYRKFNLSYAKWALKEQYQDIPIVVMAKDFLTIPLKDIKESYKKED